MGNGCSGETNKDQSGYFTYNFTNMSKLLNLYGYIIFSLPVVSLPKTKVNKEPIIVLVDEKNKCLRGHFFLPTPSGGKMLKKNILYHEAANYILLIDHYPRPVNEVKTSIDNFLTLSHMPSNIHFVSRVTGISVEKLVT